PYFHYGVRVYQGATRIPRRTAIELDLKDHDSLAGRPRLRRESLREVRFRWTVFDLNDMDFGIHGRILELTDGRHLIVAYMNLWPYMAALTFAVSCAIEGIYAGTAVMVAAGAGVIPFYRRRAERIRRIL